MIESPSFLQLCSPYPSIHQPPPRHPFVFFLLGSCGSCPAPPTTAPSGTPHLPPPRWSSNASGRSPPGWFWRRAPGPGGAEDLENGGLVVVLWDFMGFYGMCPLVTNITMEHGHRNSQFSHEKWWFFIAMLNYQRVLPKEWMSSTTWLGKSWDPMKLLECQRPLCGDIELIIKIGDLRLINGNVTLW